MCGDKMRAQAFTLEGVMASLLLLVVMYTFFHSSLVVSPMWSELSDAQLRLLAQDALKILDNSTKSEITGRFYDDSLQGMISELNESFTANSEFVNKTRMLVFPANIRLELYWIENGTINGSVIHPFDSTPTPEAVFGSRYIVLNKDDLNAPFNKSNGISDPVVFEVRLILWRP